MAFDYAEKITALLKKAEAEGVTAEEADILRQKAYDLMTKHSIDQAMIDAKRAKGESTAEDIVTDTVAFDGIYKDALVQFCHNIVVAFRTMEGYVEKNVIHIESSKRVKKHIYTIVGYESDVAQARVLLLSLQLQALAELTTWWDEDDYATVIRTGGTPMQKFKARREFIMAFSNGASAKIKARVARAMNDAGPGTELVLRSRLDEVRTWLNENRNIGHSRGRGMDRDYNAWGAGFDAGQQANTGEANIGPKRNAIES